jgi:hypothetical protein
LDRRLLQIMIVLAGMVPVGAGLMGVSWAPMIGHAGADASLDSHVRYLSGLLPGIGCLDLGWNWA